MFGIYSSENIVEPIQPCFHTWAVPFSGLCLEKGLKLTPIDWWMLDLGVFSQYFPLSFKGPPNVER